MLVRLSLVCALSLAALLPAQAEGVWEPAFNHEVNTANTNNLNIPPTRWWPPRFNALHMSLIPVGPYRGQVVVWDKAPVALEPYQRWAIVDPNWTAAGGGIGFRNFFLDMPSGTQTGDLFCAGHAWMRDGRLFVAGGTAIYNVAGGGWYGAALVYQFAPDEYDASNQDYGVWHRQPDMGVTRWYPTVTVLGDDSFLITGGTDDGVVHNDYEVYRLQGAWGESPPTPTVFDQRTNGAGNMRIYAGPPFPSGMSDYPRIHLLTTGQVFMSACYRRGVKWLHDPDNQPVYDFSAGGGSTSPKVIYGSSLLDPRQGGTDNHVLRIGGRSWSLARYDVDYCQADQPGNWSTYPLPYRLRHPRWMHNVVILPNAQLLAIGGWATGQNPGPAELRPELLKESGWSTMAPHVGPRGYHSTAMLLPDGRVLIGGADLRTVDYQIFKPPYLVNGDPRPEHIGCDIPPVVGGMRYQDDPQARVYTAFWDENLPAGVTVERVVLMRPGSTTHHSDMDMRYVRLEVVQEDEAPADDASIRFRGPVNSSHAPRGWYMLFLVTNQGVPGEAVWVHLE